MNSNPGSGLPNNMPGNSGFTNTNPGGNPGGLPGSTQPQPKTYITQIILDNGSGSNTVRILFNYSCGGGYTMGTSL
jgi:hypothetical protein